MKNRRQFLRNATLATFATTLAAKGTEKKEDKKSLTILPKQIAPILFSCKFSMIANNNTNSLEKSFQMAKDAGFDGLDFDKSGNYDIEEVKKASENTGLFIHNAINHTHWGKRFTSLDKETLKIASDNLTKSLYMSHAVGGSSVLIVIGSASDEGTQEELAKRAHEQIKKHLPLAAALGQRILIENVWNRMGYVHKGSNNQSCQGLIDFIDEFNSPWIGSYFDIGNHHLYADVPSWIRALNTRIVKLDLKGFHKKAAIESKKLGQFKAIGEGDINWQEVRESLNDIKFNGWATAEVAGGNVDQLTTVLNQMKKALLG